ncbi:methyltransferase domain-containing protein [Kribbella turkmenica]|uniref:Methyltransferase domain-containing protein n=1 Tax=Kribbella turkmenica TaxID=2530375 RepID=A0A4R4X915_9ACTN|nr:methyltransferase domain-containing protein [Kribbella turkmenica]
MLEIVGRLAGEPARFVDLACGPGSISARAVQRFPSAEIIGVDLDPFLLEIARHAVTGARFAEADLRAAGWDAVPGDGQVDAVCSATALHWLTGSTPRTCDTGADARTPDPPRWCLPERRHDAPRPDRGPPPRRARRRPAQPDLVRLARRRRRGLADVVGRRRPGTRLHRPPRRAQPPLRRPPQGPRHHLHRRRRVLPQSRLHRSSRPRPGSRQHLLTAIR